MELSRTRALLPRVHWRETSASTNKDLHALAVAASHSGGDGDGGLLPHGTLLTTDTQTAGRGRLDRGWISSPGKSLAVSMLVRGFGVHADAGVSQARDTGILGAAGFRAPEWGELGPAWLPLIAGSAAQAALQPLFRAGAGHQAQRVGMKWPNDVHVRDEDEAIAGHPGKKLCGILCEILPDGSAIVGIGMNLLIPQEELPTERATSLLAAGANVLGAESFADAAGADLADRVLAAFAGELLRLTEIALSNPEAIRSRAARHSLTVGTEVRVHLPSGEIIDGFARELATDGGLVVDRPTGGVLIVNAGDVQHLR